MKIGKIISVEYDRFKIRLYNDAKTSTVSIKGHVYYYGNIGSYLKTTNSIGESILCEVIAILDYNVTNTEYSRFNLDSSRELMVKPIGVLDKEKGFSLGIGIFPSLYSDVEIVTIEDIDSILSEDMNINDGVHPSLLLGYSKSMINYKVQLNINKLFNIHTAVLGNSGSGKSNTIAHILQEIYRKEDNYAIGAKTVLFDVNGEYTNAFDTTANLNSNVEKVFLKPNIAEDAIYHRFKLPHYLMNLDEWLAFLMASERSQKPFWSNVLQETYKFHSIFSQVSSDDASKSYLNYFKWKILSILNMVNSTVNSDTSKITAARGIILRCKEVVLQTLEWQKKGLSEDAVSNDLIRFLNEADNNCWIEYGDNKGSLATFISDQSDLIDNTKAIEINEKKLKSGEFYDYHFLKAAVDIVLMEEEARGNLRIREFASTLLSRLDFFLNNPECSFMRECGDTIYIDTEDYIYKIFGIRNGEKRKQLIIIDTSELESDTLELTTSVVSRMLFDFRKKQNEEYRRKQPIHLILDEAHRYIKKDEQYILRHNIFERIAREGRKYAIYLIVSSQRPSELSSTVLSQCGNYIIHRIQNDLDMKYIYSVLPYYSEDYPIKIRQLVPGEALVFGNFVPMPLLIKVIEANPHPNSDNCIINEEWFKIDKEENYAS